MRATGCFVADYGRVPPEVVSHLAQQLGPDPVLGLFNPATRWRAGCSSPTEASCLRLLFNAAVLWNTVQIDSVVGRLRAGGAEIDPADLAHVWPLQHARIIPNGTLLPGLAA